jgi:branched-subunit amino acid transport protein
MKGEIIPIIIGMGVVTYIPRWLPLFFLSRRRLPPWLVLWLDFIPAAILSALILPAILTAGSPRQLEWNRRDLWVAIPTLLFALRTRSLAGTVIIGMALYWLISTFYP